MSSIQGRSPRRRDIGEADETALPARKNSHRVLFVGGMGFLVLALAAGISWSISTAIPSDPVDAGLSIGIAAFSTANQTREQLTPRASNQSLPSISVLVGDLEEKLLLNPDDAKGWSLLAQTYAFLGHQSGVEVAISHAERLGVDSRQLRSRVEAASQSSSAIAGTTSAFRF